MTYEKIFIKAKKAVKEDYKKFIEVNDSTLSSFYRKIPRLKIIIDPKLDALAKYRGLTIYLKSSNYEYDIAFLLIYHEILHCIFDSFRISLKFIDSVLNLEKKGINDMLINLIQDMILDYQMKINYGDKTEAWDFMGKSAGRYKNLEKIHDKLINFIQINKIDLEIVDLEDMQCRVLEELREDIVKNYGSDLKK